MIFDKPSTRTRVSFESAAWMLGMLPIVLRPDELQLGRGETIADTARALSLYLDALTVRTFAQASVEELAAAASHPDHQRPDERAPPLPGAGRRDDPRGGVRHARRHPGRVRRRRRQRLPLADPGRRPRRLRAAHRDAPGLRAVGRRSSPGAPSTRTVTGGSIVLTHDPAEAGPAPTRSTPTSGRRWARRPKRAARMAAFAGFTVDAPMMARASTSAIFLHCLPAHRGQEVTDEVDRRTRVARLAAGRQPAPHGDRAALHRAHRRRRRGAPRMSRVVVALGGNALIRRGEEGSTAVQRRNLLAAARALVDLDRMGHDARPDPRQRAAGRLPGDRGGCRARHRAAAARSTSSWPSRRARSATCWPRRSRPGSRWRAATRPIAVVLSQTVVDPDDPAFRAPSKPVGPMYDEATARQLAGRQRLDGRARRSRLAPGGRRRPGRSRSSRRRRIRMLADSGAIVIASGGGGIPVAADRSGAVHRGRGRRRQGPRRGRSSPKRVGADALLLLTDVPAVHRGWGSAGPGAHPTAHPGRRRRGRRRRHVRGGLDGSQGHGQQPSSCAAPAASRRSASSGRPSPCWRAAPAPGS